MALYHLDEHIIVRRLTYTGDLASLATVFTNVISSVQQEDVPIGLAGGGYSSRSYTVFTDNTREILPDDRLVTTDGRELRVLGTKRVTSGSEDYMQIACEEAQD